MIRFLNLKDQICEGVNHFAFYDTVSDVILQFGDVQVFSSLQEFIFYFEVCNGKDSDRSYEQNLLNTRPLTRFLSLIPSDYFNHTI